MVNITLLYQQETPYTGVTRQQTGGWFPSLLVFGFLQGTRGWYDRGCGQVRGQWVTKTKVRGINCYRSGSCGLQT